MCHPHTLLELPATVNNQAEKIQEGTLAKEMQPLQVNSQRKETARPLFLSDPPRIEVQDLDTLIRCFYWY